jgi:hypothetical protein
MVLFWDESPCAVNYLSPCDIRLRQQGANYTFLFGVAGRHSNKQITSRTSGLTCDYAANLYTALFGFPNMNTTSAMERPQHRRNKSASVLKAMMPSSTKSHKRTPTDASQPTTSTLKENSPTFNPFMAANTPLLPPNHPHAGGILGEIQNNTTPPRRTMGTSPERPKSLHKKTLSTISLRSAGRGKDDEGEKVRPRSKSSRPPKDKETVSTPKKSKSSTSLTSVFAKSARSRSPKKGSSEENISKDKENTTPPSSANTAPHTPIWAQFSSGAAQESSTTTKVPLNDRKKAIAQEMKLYLPKEYSPSKQRNFFGMEQPSLGQQRQRPKSEVFSAGVYTATTVFDTLTRKMSNDPPSDNPKSIMNLSRKSSEETGRKPAESTHAKHTPTTNSKQKVTAATKKGSRVMAAVAVFNNKAKEAEAESKMDAKQIDVAFEAVLVSILTSEYRWSGCSP